jgi:4a-hydroxytetrahydrobiopterin dehydratase
MTEVLASKTCAPCRGEYLHLRASKLSSFTHRSQTGNWRRTLTASGASFRFRNFRSALTFLPNICELTRV